MTSAASGAVPRDQTWFRIPRPNPRAAWRILCLPHAGGSASFFLPWAKTLPAEGELVAVQYPGREERIEERCIDDMQAMVDGLVQALSRVPPLLNAPYVLLGHSMGAAIAYELCLALQRRRMRLPCRLVVSASEGPGRATPRELHRAGDRVLLEEIVRLNRRLEHLLSFPELTALVLPALRSDYRLIETYGAAPPSFAPVEVPVVALIGRDDRELNEDDARAWARVSVRGFELHAYPGGHFYLADHFTVLTELLLRPLRDCSRLTWLDLP